MKYKPGTTTADLEIFAIKEAILILTNNSIFSDPEFSGDSALIDNVILHNPPKTSAKAKAAAEEHYNASVSNYFNTDQPLLLHKAESKYSGYYNYVFYPLDKDEKYDIEFRFDDNKRLIVDTHKDWSYKKKY